MNMIDKTTIALSPADVSHRKGMDIRPGDTVRVYSKVEEKGKTRLQAFEGLVISRKHGSEPGATFTVRKIASGVGVERTFPLYSPNIDKIELVRRSKARRAKLYFIREKTAKEIRRKVKNLFGIALPDLTKNLNSAEAESAKEEEVEEVIDLNTSEDVSVTEEPKVENEEVATEATETNEVVENTEAAPASEEPKEETSQAEEAVEEKAEEASTETEEKVEGTPADLNASEDASVKEEDKKEK